MSVLQLSKPQHEGGRGIAKLKPALSLQELYGGYSPE